MIDKQTWFFLFFPSNIHHTIYYTFAKCNILICMQKHSQHNNDERTQLLKKHTSHFIRKGCKRVICERWVGDWTKTATYWPPALLARAALLSHPAGLLNRGPWEPSSLLGLVFTASNCNNWLQTLISNQLELPIAPGYIIVWRKPASVSVASALNSTRPQSRLSPDIFDRMHLLFTQAHFFFDRSAGSEVNMLQRFFLVIL